MCVPLQTPPEGAARPLAAVLVCTSQYLAWTGKSHECRYDRLAAVVLIMSSRSLHRRLQCSCICNMAHRHHRERPVAQGQLHMRFKRLALGSKEMCQVGTAMRMYVYDCSLNLHNTGTTGAALVVLIML